MQHCWVEVSASAIRNNYQIFRNLVGDAVIAPVIKANAYGHGIEEVFQTLKSEQPSWLCVAYLDEAKCLREAGYGGRILIVAPVFADELSDAFLLKADILMTHKELLTAWLAADDKPHLHMKIDTGLTRQGFAGHEVQTVVAQLQDHRDLVAGVCTHFANVEDVLEHGFADQQMKRFFQARAIFDGAGFKPIYHCASSASALLLEGARMGMCRVGISLYGFWPSQSTKLSYLQLNQGIPDLQPALSWKARVSSIKAVPAGSFIGYGCSFKANHDMTAAVLPLGYYEGYPRLAGNHQSFVLIKGTRCPLIGRVSMNLMVADVTHIADQVKVYDEVTLIGRDGSECITAEMLADWSETIQYELVSGINARLERKIVT